MKQAKAARGAGISGAGMIFQQAISFISGVFVARMLGAVDYGTFNIVRNIANVAIIFTKAGLDIGLNRRLGERLEAESPAQAGEISFAAALVAALLSLLWLAVCAFWLADFFERNLYSREGFSSLMLQMMIIVPLWSVLQVIAAAFRARLDPNPGVIGEMVIQPALRLALSVFFTLLGYGVGGVVWANVLAALAGMIYVSRCAMRYFAIGGQWWSKLRWSELWDVRGYSLVMALSVAIVTLTRSLDILILGVYAPADEVGRYAVIQMCAVLLTLFGAAFGQLLGPQVASLWATGRRAEIRGLLRENTRLIVLTAAPCLMVLLFFGTSLITVFGSEFRVSPWVLASLAVSQFAVSALSNVGWVLSMTGRHNAEMALLAIGLVVALVLNFALVPTYGAMGAAVATLASTIVANGARIYVVFRSTGILPFDAEVFVILAFSLATAFLVKAGLGLLGGGEGLLAGVLGSMVYLLIYSWMAFRLALREDERSWLISRVRAAR